MFLVTTADERFLRTDGEVLLLGEWCRLFSDAPRWLRVPHKVLPYHWDDRERMHRDFRYLQDLHETLLAQLVPQLNLLHERRGSVRYWRIIVGPWLSYFLHSLYDRYLSIEAAASSHLVTETLVSSDAADRWTPTDMAAFADTFTGDGYNQFIYSRLILENGTIPHTRLEPDEPARPTARGQMRAQAKTAVRNALAAAVRRLTRRNGHIVLVDPYMQRRDQYRLELSLGQWPYLVTPKIVARDVPVSWDQRGRLRLRQTGTPFEKIATDLIPQLMPKSYVEEYARIRARALREFPRHPAGIFTAIAYSSDEGFKLWSAECVDNGVPLLVGQHGGHYGTGRWSGTEEHEFLIADRYYTWGWSAPEQPKAKPMPCIKMRAMRRVRARSADGPILWVMNTSPRYAYHLYSIPMGPQRLAYLSEQERFYAALPEAVRQELLLRLYPKDYGWQERQRWIARYPELKLAKDGPKLSSMIHNCRMAVVTFNTTTSLETFAADCPTLLYWNPAHWELRDRAEPFFNALRGAGILHDTPEAAASKLQEVYLAPRAWWESAPVRRARQSFSGEFIRSDVGWLDVWQRELSTDAKRRTAAFSVGQVPASRDSLPPSPLPRD